MGKRFTVYLYGILVAHAPYAWIISPHVSNEVFTDNYQHDQEHSKELRVHVFPRGRISISFGDHDAVMFIETIQHLHSPGLHWQLFMDGIDPSQWHYLCEVNAKHVRIAAGARAIAAMMLVNGVLDELQRSKARRENA